MEDAEDRDGDQHEKRRKETCGLLSFRSIKNMMNRAGGSWNSAWVTRFWISPPGPVELLGLCPAGGPLCTINDVIVYITV